MINRLPRVSLAHLPTPVEFLPRITEKYGGPQIFVKRDDQTGLAFGGNKTRKLEYLIAAAVETGATHLITGGAVQSNHCRQTAAAAARSGLECTLVLSGSPPVVASGNFLLDRLFGAKTVIVDRGARDSAMDLVYQQLVGEGHRPFLIPYGGSNPVGASAYAFAMKELLDQDPLYDWIVLASSSGGTHAGLAAGAELFGFGGKILGISIDEPKEVLQSRVAGLAVDTLELLDARTKSLSTDVLINADYLGGGYGVLGEPEVRAIHLFAALEGLLLDPVYTGRAAAGLIDLLERGYFGKNERVLFWHTGGTPALLAQMYEKEILAK